MKFYPTLIFLVCFSLSVYAQTENIEINQFIEGTFVKVNAKNSPLAILIQGSGPTDRNGNGPGMKSDHSKMLAKELNKKGINTFSYDKRSVKMIKEQEFQKTTLFDDFINDQIEIIQFFKDKGYSNIHLIGHSQGSLIAILAAQKEEVNSIISLAGTSRTIDKIIVEQIEKKIPGLKDKIEANFENLKNNEELSNIDNPVISSIFANQNQSFLKNYMSYKPIVEIEKLNQTPILIINGDADIQVPVSDAKELQQHAQNSKISIINHMNHVLKIVNDYQSNLASYNAPDHPISQKLIWDIEKFIKQHANSN